MHSIRTIRESRKSGSFLHRGKRSRTRVARSERGIALVVALVMLALLGILGSMALYTSTTELRIAGNYRSAQSAFFVADTAIEFAYTFEDIYTSIIPGLPPNDFANWPVKGAGVPAVTGDPDFNGQYFDIPTEDGTIVSHPADIRVEWETCGSMPVGSGRSMEASIGSEKVNKGNYFLINVVGSLQNKPQTRIAIEAFEVRAAAACPGE